MRPAVFLDRDGTINEERDYLFRCEDFRFIPGVPQAIKRLNDAGLLVVVVTNQSGVGRGYYSEKDVDCLHKFIQQQLCAIGAHIDAFYYCPHHPTKGLGQYKRDCNCRKGKPGMLLQAAQEHCIDLGRSFIVGDKLADVEAGVAAGCAPLLVLTGYGAQQQRLVAPETTICADLTAAVTLICGQ
ncbi:MAG: D-glycero-beta-D-manno-heptose 1,7-bisphosphate 7-phosphatase [Desulfuromonas sp.]|nr:D-glycero-beta-D-manno-heptose 1,7-bisphosphate 7-phosphatase [Desulfuromonas sp.]